MARLLVDMDKPIDALREYHKALGIRVNISPSNSSLLARSHNNIAILLHKLGRLAEVCICMYAYVSLYMYVYMQVCMYVYVCVCMYVCMYVCCQAYTSYKKVLHLRVKDWHTHSHAQIQSNAAHEHKHTHTHTPSSVHIHSMCESYNNMGLILHDLGKYDDAETHYRKALDIVLQQSKAADDPDVAVCYNNMGAFFEDKGEADKALQQYRKSMKIWIEFFGEDSSYCKVTLSNIQRLINQTTTTAVDISILDRDEVKSNDESESNNIIQSVNKEVPKSTLEEWDIISKPPTTLSSKTSPLHTQTHQKQNSVRKSSSSQHLNSQKNIVLT